MTKKKLFLTLVSANFLFNYHLINLVLEFEKNRINALAFKLLQRLFKPKETIGIANEKRELTSNDNDEGLRWVFKSTTLSSKFQAFLKEPA